MTIDDGARTPANPELKRALTLPLVVLYGLGVTIGAGIYVLIGVTAARAGALAPLSFVIAATVMIFSASSFAELSGRYPVSAGEAAYVRAGFNRAWLSTLVGLLVVLTGSVSAAAIAIGSTGYIQAFVDWPNGILVPLVILAMAAIAAVGIMESVVFAAALTLIEIGGLLAIIAGGMSGEPGLVTGFAATLPSHFTLAIWSGVVSASLIAFFAFVGFEDMVNIAEEVEQPQRVMPWAIFLTLGIATLLYVLVVAVAVVRVPIDELAASKAPLGLVFERVTSLPLWVIGAIAVVSTLNGIIIQLIMASRVIYGLAGQRSLPAALAHINPLTRTPLRATALVSAFVLLLATAFPLEVLAEKTSQVTLVVFTLVNLALLRLKRLKIAPPEGVFVVPLWVPALGFATCLMLLILGTLA